MTRNDAAKILGVTPQAKRRAVNRAFADLRQQFTKRSQYATQPADRDNAAKALRYLQEAYKVMTGAAVAEVPRRRRQSPPTSTGIPRHRVQRRSHGAPAPTAKPSNRSRIRIVWILPYLLEVAGIPKEKTLAYAICIVAIMFFLMVSS